jgi:chromodomain-helicase-DNA-binding protein 4
VDEGHRLKNNESKLFVALTKQWNARHRLILTGTPLQNDLNELFNLLCFVEPTKYEFEKLHEQYANVQQKEIVEKLHDLLRPHLLRRMKSEVLKNMIPDKVSLVVPVSATGFQKTLYKNIVNKNFQYLSQGTKAGKKALLNILMQLRKVCNHPYLFDGVEPETKEKDEEAKLLIEASGKMILLDKMLPKLKAGGHRVLLFSQMTRVLDIIEDYLRVCHHLLHSFVRSFIHYL